MTIDMDALIEQVRTKQGCITMRAVAKDPEALEFLNRITVLNQSGTKISPSKAAKAVEENWHIVINPARLCEHFGGTCACQKTK